MVCSYSSLLFVHHLLYIFYFLSVCLLSVILSVYLSFFFLSMSCMSACHLSVQLLSSIFNLNTFYINPHMYVHHRSPFICPSSVCLLSVFSSVRLLFDHHMYCTTVYVPLFFPFYNLSVCLYCMFVFYIMPVFYEILPSCLLCIPIYIYYLTDGVTGCSTRTVCSEHHFKAHYKRFYVCVEFADTELSNFQYRIQVFCFLHSNPHCPCH